MSLRHRTLRRPALATALLAAAVGVAPLLVASAAPAAAAPADIRINEIVSNGPGPDSIELTNIGTEPVDVSGWIVKDDNDTRTLAIAAGTSVAPGGFLVVQVDGVTGGFGLGANDTPRIFQPGSTTPVDSYAYTGHSAPSWSRCADGTGTFVRAMSQTLGAANDCPGVEDLVINEVESNGDQVGDWVEIANPTGAAIDASGLVVRDNDGTHAMPVPAGTTIPAGGYAAVYTEPVGDPAGFGLGGSDSARLFTADGATLIDSYTWTAHASITYGRCPDRVGDFALTSAPTRAAANSCPLPDGAGNVRINEIVTNSATVGDSIELTNIGAAPVDVSGFVLKDDDAASAVAIPVGTTIPAGGFRSFLTNTGATGFSLGDGDQARLYLADGVTLLDSHDFASHSNPSWSRCPDGTGPFVQAQAETLGAANACTVPNAAVKINEVESNGESTDWVELYNTGTGPVDISGWIVRDDKDTSAATVPAGTSLAAGAYYAVETNVATGSTNFGLGEPDKARLFAADGTTLIDSYEWQTHATTTYGRCPNGTGDFATTVVGTRAAANDCPVPAGVDAVEINEVFSNGVDFVEIRNVSDDLVDASDFWFVDNDPTHTAFQITTESTPLQPGDLFAFEPDAVGGIGLGSADTANILLSDKVTVVDSYSWTSHRTPSYGRCPGETGLVQNAAASPGAANVCQPVRINEVESNGGTPGDWIELINMTASPVDVSGWVVRDKDETPSHTIPASTSIPADGHLVLEEAALGFGLGGDDSARLYRADGTTLVDTHSWTAHATTTYGRCPNGTGGFVTTKSSTKGAVNDCPPPFHGVDTEPWPGSQSITVSDPVNVFDVGGRKGDISGLVFDPVEPGVLWAVKNKNRLYKLTKVGGLWTPVATGGWATGKELRFANGAGEPDAEGITIGPDGAIYTTSERDNLNDDVASNKVLRFDPTQAAPLVATREWDLQSEFPELGSISGGSNLGFEGITWVPDSFLVAGGFVDERTGAAYQPSSYPGHGDGLFFTALENDGALYAYALGAGLQTRVAKVASGFPHVMDVSFDPERRQLWAVCDDTCDGQVSQLKIGGDGKFAVVGGYQRPTGMPNLNNEGFAVAPQSTCVDGFKEVVWSDDGATGDHSLRSSTLPCAALIASTAAPQISGTPRAGQVLSTSDGTWSVDGLGVAYQWARDGVAIEGATDPAYLVVAADKGELLTVTVTVSKAGYETASRASAAVTVEDLPLLVTTPEVTGAGRVGVALTVSNGAWDEAGLSFAYQWLRSGTPIAGATAASYTPTADDLAAGSVTARITASRVGGIAGAPATTAPTPVVAGDAASATVAPTVSGIAVTGQRLTGTPGTWSVPGLAVAYQWLRDGAPIPGASAASYTLVGADAGRAVSLRVTASRPGYADGTATSAAVRATGPVASTTRLLVKRKVVAGKKAVATVRVNGAHDPAGKVELTFRSGGRTVTVTGRLSNGRASIAVPARLKAGKHRVVASYAGDALHQKSTSAAATVTVVEKKPKKRG